VTLRKKLILAFLLLAVIPLTGITIYSYNSSIKAFRKVAEAESGALADEMGGRMDSVRRDLANRMERLGRFPFRRLMAFRGDRSDPKSNPFMAELMVEMGDTASLLDSIEFNPAPEGAPPGPQGKIPAPPPPPAPTKPSPAGQIEPERLVIRLSPDAPATPAAGRQGVTRNGMVIQVQPELPALPPGSARPPAGRERQRIEAQLSRNIQEYQDVLRKMGASIDEKRIAAQVKNAVEAANKAADQAARLQHADPLASHFGSVVRVDGESVGTVEARVSSRQVFHDVLSRTRRRQGEIPFVVDGEGKLHAINQPDRSKLEALGLPGVSPKSPAQTGVMTVKDWVVVTRKDPGSDLAFGIARPTGQALGEIRRTAARNLGLGLGMVGLALIGIIPLSNRMTRNLAVLTRGAEQLARGDLSTRVPVRTRDEIGRLAEAFNRMAHDLSDNQKHLVEQERLQRAGDEPPDSGGNAAPAASANGPGGSQGNLYPGSRGRR
jgi:HAMP domain-containing protein